MESSVDRVRAAIWGRRGVGGRIGWLVLQPVSAVFGAAVALRNLGYRTGILRTQRAGIPVVSIGNLSVGGTGKTPVTLWLARELTRAGARVAIVLRGYTGTVRQATIVSRGTGPEVGVEVAGDEAVMLSKCFDGVVVVAPQRAEGVALAADVGCTVALLDDGFQHRALARDFDLVLIAENAGSLLPAGPLRERRGALKRADAVALVTKLDDGSAPPPELEWPRGVPTFAVRFAAAALVVSDSGRWREMPLEMLSGRRVAVITGIANPGPVYATIRQWEAQIEEIFSFPDHHRYSQADWQRLSRDTRLVELIVTTEKDLVKLENFPFAKEKLVALRIVPEIDHNEKLVRMVLARTGLAPTGDGGHDGDQ